MSKWEKVKIKDIGQVITGNTPSTNKSEFYESYDIPFVKPHDLNDIYVKGLFDFTNYVSEKARSSIRIVPEGSVLVSCIGIIGKVGVAFKDTAFNQQINAVIPNPLKVESLYLAYIFIKMKNILRDKANSAVVPIINKSQFSEIAIPLPPLEIQKQIAKNLDTVSELLTLRKKQLEVLDGLIKSVFYDMFGDPVENEKGWKVKKFPQIISNTKNSLKRGPFGGALKKEIFKNEGYLVYEQHHALNNDYSFKRYFIDQKTFRELEAFEVKAGDILISCSGVYLGKLSIVPENALPGIINQALLKVTLDSDKMNQIFFVQVFSNTNFKEKYITTNRGSGIPNLPPMSVMKEIDFIAPPLSLQNQFASIVIKIEEQKALVKQSIEETQSLFDSLMSQYFDD